MLSTPSHWADGKFHFSRFQGVLLYPHTIRTNFRSLTPSRAFEEGSVFLFYADLFWQAHCPSVSLLKTGNTPASIPESFATALNTTTQDVSSTQQQSIPVQVPPGCYREVDARWGLLRQLLRSPFFHVDWLAKSHLFLKVSAFSAS